MTKRDAIEAMARAMEMHAREDGETLLLMARDAYEAIAEMAKAELKSRCSVTGQPLTIRQQFESECG